MGPMKSTVAAMSKLQGAVRLADWGVIRATGNDAAAFLQGQLTQDVLRLDAGSVRLAGYCTAKGRLLATFLIWRRGPAEFLLACSADLLPAVLKRLKMFVLRAKCQLEDASAEWPLWGLAGDAALAALGSAAPAAAWQRVAPDEGRELLRLDDVQGVPRWLFAGGEPPALPALAPEAWAWLEVQSAVPRIVAATVEQFVPQMVNLELVDGVNFQKGCYPGQEIVARSQYRGTLKRRAYLFDADAAAAAGQDLYAADDPAQPAGMVVAAAPSPDGAGAWAVLAETKIAALADGVALHLGAADGPALRPAALPYAIPAAEA